MPCCPRFCKYNISCNMCMRCVKSLFSNIALAAHAFLPSEMQFYIWLCLWETKIPDFIAACLRHVCYNCGLDCHFKQYFSSGKIPMRWYNGNWLILMSSSSASYSTTLRKALCTALPGCSHFLHYICTWILLQAGLVQHDLSQLSLHPTNWTGPALINLLCQHGLVWFSTLQ